jgi:hypothetical protein
VEATRAKLGCRPFSPTNHAAPKRRDEEKQRQRQPVARAFYQYAARRRKDPSQDQSRDCCSDEPAQQAFHFGDGQDCQQEQEHRRVLADPQPTAKCRDAEKDDRGKESPGEGSETKQARPVLGKRCANGKH